MRCAICGRPPTQKLKCQVCHKVAAFLCDGRICQPKSWALGPQEKPSVVPLLNLRCGVCENRCELAELTTGRPGLQPLIHFIWLKGALPYRARRNLARWIRRMTSDIHPFRLVVWMDRECQELQQHGKRFTPLDSSLAALLQEFHIVSDTAYKPFEDSKAVPIAFVEDWFEQFSRAGLLSAKCMNVLFDAIAYETYEDTLGLVQVASDILRILLLRVHGGAYFDFDVEPADRRFPTAPKVLFPPGIKFLCHVKPREKHPENDIIFVDHTDVAAARLLDAIIAAMTAFYEDDAGARTKALQKKLSGLDLKGIRKALDTFKAKVSELGEESPLYQLAPKLNAQGAESLQKAFYPKNIHPQITKYHNAIMRSVNDSTFHAYKQAVQEHTDQNQLLFSWKRMAPCFTGRTDEKEFYSWQTPGLGVVDNYSEAAGVLVKRLGMLRASNPKHKQAPKQDSETWVESPEQRLILFRGRIYKYEDKEELEDICEKLTQHLKGEVEEASLFERLASYEQEAPHPANPNQSHAVKQEPVEDDKAKTITFLNVTYSYEEEDEELMEEYRNDILEKIRYYLAGNESALEQLGSYARG